MNILKKIREQPSFLRYNLKRTLSFFNMLTKKIKFSVYRRLIIDWVIQLDAVE